MSQDDVEVDRKQREREEFEKERERKRAEAKKQAQLAAAARSKPKKYEGEDIPKILPIDNTADEELTKKQIERQKIEEERERKRIQLKQGKEEAQQDNTLLQKQLERERLEKERKEKQEKAKLERQQSTIVKPAKVYVTDHPTKEKKEVVPNVSKDSSAVRAAPSAIPANVIPSTPPGSPGQVAVATEILSPPQSPEVGTALTQKSESPSTPPACSICAKPITTKYLENSEGKKIHPECAKPKKKATCTTCGEQIVGPKVAATGLYWHPKCFLCTYCGTQLKTTFVLKKQSAFCNSTCFSESKKSLHNIKAD